VKRQEPEEGQAELFPTDEVLFFTERGYGFRLDIGDVGVTTKKGKRVVRLAEKDNLRGAIPVEEKLLLFVTEQGYGLCMANDEAPLLNNAGKGVILQKVPAQDRLLLVCSVKKQDTIKVSVDKGKPRAIEVKALTISKRAKRGLKVVKRGTPVLGLVMGEEG